MARYQTLHLCEPSLPCQHCFSFPPIVTIKKSNPPTTQTTTYLISNNVMADDKGLKRIVIAQLCDLTWRRVVSIALVLVPLLASFAAAQTVTFQEGVAGYTGTVDTFVDSLNPTTDHSAATFVYADDHNPIAHGLIRFDDIFGSDAAQIPLGATITAASLTVNVTQSTGASANITLHRMLTPWTGSDTWNTFVNGVQADDIEAAFAIDSTLANPNTTSLVTFSGPALVATLQAWSNGTATNHGWAILNDHNFWVFSSSEEATISLRPQLMVTYVPGITVSNTNNAGPGSLRQAIIDANTMGGTDTISFNIPLTDPNHYYYRDDGIPNSLSLEATTALDDASITDFDPDYPGTPHSWYRIQPLSALPIMTETAIIDGYTQLGAQANTVAAPGLSDAILKIEINGDAAVGTHLFRTQVGADFSEFRGLVINGDFTRPLRLDSNSNIVAGNYIGTDITGTQLPLSGNLINENGVTIQNNGRSNTIGGFIPEDRNLISASVNDGVRITSSGSINNIVVGNFIGTDITGNIALGSNVGVRLRGGANNNTIGGVGAAGNVISGASTLGIMVIDSPSNTIQGNLIGTNAGGSGPINAPAKQGIRIIRSDNTLIGGTFAGEGNVIAYHTEVGVQLDADAGTGTSILGNSIFSNDDVAPGMGLGIDLNDDGVTANDLDDLDTGPNDLQNFPVLTSANTDGVGTFYIGGVIHSTASRSFRIEVFANTLADPSGNGEGETYLGFTNVTTDASGNGAFSTVFLTTVPENAFITATATDQVTDDTSEFSPYVIAQDMGHVVVDTTTDVADAPDTSSITALLTNRGSDDLISLREAILATNSSPNGAIVDQIYFNMPNIDPGHVYYRDDSTANALSLVVPTLQDDASITDFDPDYPGPGHSWFSIQLATPLPPITDSVDLDATSQPGFTNHPLIELDGSAVAGGNENGFTLQSGSTFIRGFAINRFLSQGIEIDLAGNNTIEGNYIGTDITGSLARGNAYGISVKSNNNMIGGTSTAQRNLLSGNANWGVAFYAFASDNTLQGNYIGTHVAGTNALGNSGTGVRLYDGAANTTIGGTGVGEGNLIAYNANKGIVLQADAGDGNAIRGNSIHSNTGLGIDLGDDGLVDLDDINDSDSGPNQKLNSPDITAAVTNEIDTLTLNVALHGLPGTNFDLDFFYTVGESDEGATYLGSHAISTDGSGNYSMANLVLTPVVVPDAAYITATATVTSGPETGNTSEFSEIFQASPVNLPPLLSNLEGLPLPYTENDAPMPITSTLSVSDADDTELAAATLTVSAGYVNGEDQLNFTDMGNITGSWNPSSGTLTLSGVDTLANYETALRSVTYTNLSEAPDPATRTLSITVDDGSAPSNLLTRNIAITAENDDPHDTGTLPTDRAVTEDTATQIDLSTMNLADPDAGTNPLTLSLSTAVGGSLMASSSGGVTASGSGTATLTLDGTITALNAFLDDPTNIQYLSALNAEGDNADLLTVSVTDNGHTGSNGGGIVPLGSANIDITPVNDAPELDNTGDMTLTDVIEDSSNPAGNSVASIIDSAGGDRITDVDSGAVEGIAVIGVDDSNGTWEYSTNGGANWLSFTANGVASGAPDDTSAILLDGTALIRFVPNASYTGSAGDLTFHAWDQSQGANGDTGVNASTQGGSTPYSLNVETAALSVIAVSGMINLVPGAQHTDEDTSLTFSTGNGNSISVDDGSAADPLLRTSLSVTNGILTLPTIAGITFENGANGTDSMTISGLESAINAALDGLDYTPISDYHGTENLQIVTDTFGGLIAQYTFDNPLDPGNDDSPGSANDGTLMGGATTVFDAVRGSDVLQLDGTDDHVMIPGLLGEPQHVTLAAWVNLDPGLASKNDELISIGDSAAIRLDANVVVDLGVTGFYYAGGIIFRNNFTGTEVAGTGWHHIAYTIDTTNDIQVVYIDGVAVKTENHTNLINYGNGTDTYIGRRGAGIGSFFLHGKVDDARIYDRALSAAEVADLFAGAMGGGSSSDTDDIAITVNPVADTPSVTDTSTLEDTQTTSGLTISLNPADGPEVTHFKITSITGGNLYQNDGTTPRQPWRVHHGRPG